mmetsp:Transcript_4426/g.15386  ORF Transcript_4426/g.15386 Transcript_4426/m.15386 type:complete len:495 (-) Transcript_4426:42-1526(-)
MRRRGASDSVSSPGDERGDGTPAASTSKDQSIFAEEFWSSMGRRVEADLTHLGKQMEVDLAGVQPPISMEAFGSGAGGGGGGGKKPPQEGANDFWTTMGQRVEADLADLGKRMEEDLQPQRTLERFQDLGRQLESDFQSLRSEEFEEKSAAWLAQEGWPKLDLFPNPLDAAASVGLEEEPRRDEEGSLSFKHGGTIARGVFSPTLHLAKEPAWLPEHMRDIQRGRHVLINIIVDEADLESMRLQLFGSRHPFQLEWVRTDALAQTGKELAYTETDWVPDEDGRDVRKITQEMEGTPALGMLMVKEYTCDRIQKVLSAEKGKAIAVEECIHSTDLPFGKQFHSRMLMIVSARPEGGVQIEVTSNCVFHSPIPQFIESLVDKFIASETIVVFGRWRRFLEKYLMQAADHASEAEGKSSTQAPPSAPAPAPSEAEAPLTLVVDLRAHAAVVVLLPPTAAWIYVGAAAAKVALLTLAWAALWGVIAQWVLAQQRNRAI